MNILIIIPARGGSKGLKEKNIKPLVGKPLIGYTIEAALESELADKIVVSTEDRRIAEVSMGYGIQVVDRPAEYSTDTAPIEWALRDAVPYLAESQKYVPDIMVWLQANVPIRKKGQIDNVIQKLIDTGADSVITVTEVTQRPEFMWKKTGDRIVKLTKAKETRRQELGEPLYIADGAVIAIKSDVLMNTEGLTGAHVYLGEDVRCVVEEPQYAVEIDDQFDFDVAEGLLLNRRSR